MPPVFATRIRKPLNPALVLGLVFAVILTCSFTVYFAGLSDFWLFDDKSNLAENARLSFDPTEFDEWRAASLSSNSGPLRRPISMLSFAAQSGLLELSPEISKTINIAIHLLCGLLICLTAIRILRQLDCENSFCRLEAIGLLAGAIWLFQPLHASTVLYSVQRMAQLATLFMLLGVWLFACVRARWAETGASLSEVIACGMWLLLITALAALSKENGLLLPWLCVAVEVTVFRGRWAGRDLSWLRRLGWIALGLPLVVLLVAFALDPGFILGGYATREFSLQERLLTQPRILWEYVLWLLVPAIGEMGLHHDDVVLSAGIWKPWTTWLALAAWGAILLVAFALRKRAPLLLLAVLIFLIGHAMESSLWALEMVFEHRNYLPSVGLSLLVAWLIYEAATKWFSIKPMLLAAPVVAVLAVFLFIRVTTWSDSLRLAQVSAVNHPSSARSLSMYADELLMLVQSGDAGNVDVETRGAWLWEARQYYERAHAADTRSIGPLIMLYQVDSQYFPSLGTEGEWLDKAVLLLEDRRLSASDHNALKTLLRCLGSGRCGVGGTVAKRILDKLYERYPGSQRVVLMEYEYLLAADAPLERRLSLLQSAVNSNPSAKLLYTRLIGDLGKAGRLGEAQDRARDYMRLDKQRWQLPVTKGFFARPEQSS